MIEHQKGSIRWCACGSSYRPEASSDSERGGGGGTGRGGRGRLCRSHRRPHALLATTLNPRPRPSRRRCALHRRRLDFGRRGLVLGRPRRPRRLALLPSLPPPRRAASPGRRDPLPRVASVAIGRGGG